MSQEKKEDFVQLDTAPENPSKPSPSSDTDSLFKVSTSSKDSAASLWYGPIKSGSLRGCIISMVASTLGSGLLSLPYGIGKIGLIPGSLLLLFVSLSSSFMLHLLLLAGLKTKTMNYGDLLTKLLGIRIQKLYSFCSSIIYAGCIMSYMVSSYEMLEQFILQIFNINLIPHRKLLYSGCCLLFQIPLSLLRDTSKLQFASLMASIMFVLTNLIVICEAPFFYMENKSTGKIQFHLFKPFSLMTYIESAAIFMFGFINHNALLEILNTMIKPNLTRCRKVVNGSWFINFMFYFTMGVAGYISKGESTPAIFITRDDLIMFSPDWFIIMSRLVISLSLFCLIPLRWKIFRENIRGLMGYEEMPIHVDVGMTVIGMILLNVLVYNTDIITVIGVVGGVFAVVVCFAIPLMDYIWAFRKKREKGKMYFGLIVFSLFTVIGVVSTGMSIVDVFK